MTIERVEFFADPCCPWTWNTSRWLVDVAGRTGTAITWRTLSLAELNRDRDVPAHFVPRLACSRRMARVLEGLRARGRNDDMASMFTAFGTRLHLDEQEPGDGLIDACAVDCLLDTGMIASLADDESWDDAITASVAEAMELAGPDVGSPIIAVPERGRAFFGPIVSPPPSGEKALALWSVLETALGIDTFFELKRGRRDGVAFAPRP